MPPRSHQIEPSAFLALHGLVSAVLKPHHGSSSTELCSPGHALTEKAYKAAALLARALNVLSLLMAYQAELCVDFVQTQDPATWEEILVITDLCLHVQRCAVQATGRELGAMILQERAQWLKRKREGCCPGHAHCPGGNFWFRVGLDAMAA